MRFYLERNFKRFCPKKSIWGVLEQRLFLQNLFSVFGALIFILPFSHFSPKKQEKKKAEKEEKTEEKEEKRKPFHFHFYPHFFSKKGREVEKETDFFLLHFPLFSF